MTRHGKLLPSLRPLYRHFRPVADSSSIFHSFDDITTFVYYGLHIQPNSALEMHLIVVTASHKRDKNLLSVLFY